MLHPSRGGGDRPHEGHAQAQLELQGRRPEMGAIRPKRASIEMHFGQTLIETFSNALRPPTTTPRPRARLHFPATAARFGSATFFVSLSSALKRDPI